MGHNNVIEKKRKIAGKIWCRNGEGMSLTLHLWWLLKLVVAVAALVMMPSDCACRPRYQEWH
jgi:hypothetical protein